MLSVAKLSRLSGQDLRNVLCAEATRILEEDRAMCRRIGENGAPLIPDGARILTHCNAGALATAGIGTALAAIYVAVEQGKRVEVFADETRPLLQGSRLTAWELERAGIPVTVLVDSAAASLMRDGASISASSVRIASRPMATSPIKWNAAARDLRAIPRGAVLRRRADEHRRRRRAQAGDRHRATRCDEVCSPRGTPTAPDGVAVYNPAFDVTPAELVTAIITDRRVERAPFDFTHNAE
jgi:methylthioribose-1-phosphate isomerase